MESSPNSSTNNNLNWCKKGHLTDWGRFSTLNAHLVQWVQFNMLIGKKTESTPLMIAITAFDLK